MKRAVNQVEPQSSDEHDERKPAKRQIASASRAAKGKTPAYKHKPVNPAAKRKATSKDNGKPTTGRGTRALRVETESEYDEEVGDEDDVSEEEDKAGKEDKAQEDEKAPKAEFFTPVTSVEERTRQTGHVCFRDQQDADLQDILSIINDEMTLVQAGEAIAPGYAQSDRLEEKLLEFITLLEEGLHIDNGAYTVKP